MITFSRISALINHFRPPKRISLLHTFAAAVDQSGPLLSLLELAIETHSFKLGLQAHARAQLLGLTQHSLIAQKLIFSYSHFKRPNDAHLVFDSILVKNPHICNTLLSGYGKNQLLLESLGLFREMCENSILPFPDDFTFSIMFKIVGDFGEVSYGKMVQCWGVKLGLVLDNVVGNSLISMYDRCGCFDDCLKMFDEMPLRNASSYNALISGFARANVENVNNSFGKYKLWDFVRGMQNEGLEFDTFTISTLLPFCDKFCHGAELHSYIVRNGFDSDVHLGCCLIDMYSKNGRVDLGRKVFGKLQIKNVFTWTAMINGHAHCGEFDEALFLFREMQGINGVGPNKVSLVAILPACSSLAGLLGAKQIHGFAIRREINHELTLCNALIDTYSKCGSLSYANRVFEHECVHKDAISWGSIISGYGLHGQGRMAVTLFDKMLENKIEPVISVIVGVLSACCKSGLINDGMRIYDKIMNAYKIEPTVEMCACVVDMFGQSGDLKRALDFINSMRVEPGPSVWGALLSASAVHGNTEMHEVAYKSLVRLEPDNSSNYVSLSNLYAASKKWDVVARVRTVMKERGLRKVPGCSWISINSTTHNFYVADKSHPCSGSIHTMLDGLVSAMKLNCYSPDFVCFMEVLE
ncbi:pentatricopeptide repeat-containing protein at3g57430 chloroplastic [Phtheirospermum japonicum]|uniref:Pentatricopeptide repeat-containing protein at3g57430 chloroplastic n=1 Tax=Phtheirospermum japonicum TaxID=374723 RepID=A0A830B7Z2_9LAMI|nr:pentatricopeptide repeat-containing protein at3g57430 chloroplastic [Phtheirospermum japonicum]